MAIAITALHKWRVADQVQQNLIGLQRDMAENAVSHKAMATAQDPDLATLQTFVSDCAAEYLRRLQWVIDIRNNPTRRQRLLDILASFGWTEQEITDLVQGLRQAAVALRDASKTTYVEIITACDAVTSAVDMPDSLWPE